MRGPGLFNFRAVQVVPEEPAAERIQFLRFANYFARAAGDYGRIALCRNFCRYIFQLIQSAQGASALVSDGIIPITLFVDSKLYAAVNSKIRVDHLQALVRLFERVEGLRELIVNGDLEAKDLLVSEYNSNTHQFEVSVFTEAQAQALVDLDGDDVALADAVQQIRAQLAAEMSERADANAVLAQPQ